MTEQKQKPKEENEELWRKGVVWRCMPTEKEGVMLYLQQIKDYSNKDNKDEHIIKCKGEFLSTSDTIKHLTQELKDNPKQKYFTCEHSDLQSDPSGLCKNQNKQTTTRGYKKMTEQKQKCAYCNELTDNWKITTEQGHTLYEHMNCKFTHPI